MHRRVGADSIICAPNRGFGEARSLERIGNLNGEDKRRLHRLALSNALERRACTHPPKKKLKKTSPSLLPKYFLIHHSLALDVH